jgi:hypothetical protein
MTRPATGRDLVILTLLALALLAAGAAVTWTGADDASAWDVPLYESFGDRMLDGEVPYRDFRVEYPAGSLPAFLLPAIATRWFGDDGDSVYEPELNDAARSYATSFALLMALLLAVTVVASAVSLHALGTSVGKAGASLAVVAATPLLLGELALTRFDALPVALTAVATAVLLRGRPVVAGVLLGVAIATKLYPLLLLPLLWAYVARRGGRRRAWGAVAASAAAAAVVVLPFATLAPGEAWFSVRAQLARGLQVESLPASVVLAIDSFLERALSTGIASIDEGGTGAVRSADVVGVAGTIVGTVSALLTLAIVLWIWLGALRSTPDRASYVRCAAAVVAAQLAFGRVLSPQFVLWLVPFVPLVQGRRGRAALGLLVVALLTTRLWFPESYRDYVNTQEPLAILLLLARNLVLVAILAALVVPARWVARASWLRASAQG